MTSSAELTALESPAKEACVLWRPCASTPYMAPTADATAAVFCSAKLLSIALTSVMSLACAQQQPYGCSVAAFLGLVSLRIA